MDINSLYNLWETTCGILMFITAWATFHTVMDMLTSDD
jgi:hypothetical protein